MIWGPLRDEDPDRLYTITGGRSIADRNDMDTVTLIVSECEPTPGMQSEHADILRMCRNPMAVVEVSAHLNLPVSIVKVLLGDLVDAGRVTARPPSSAKASHELPDTATLERVLVGLQQKL